MTRPSCCAGSTYVLPNAPMRNAVPTSRKGPPAWVPVDESECTSWAVLCVDCDHILAVVDGPRDEVYADL